eukprot:gnl/MRDRNA2_/MRDRNA2_83397_c0_seq2.p1 gnl/MRDRNA2_/MRDRNA2_83397_c0~~gnl/MRDRNA2_/MRDRNA2_83397_c0_seq2.p1  ORF type:complete len:366 (+),score=77.79 gnl/MRDRNA2_/MRDRNA2_83397_c0_seq2:73-1098(+)
MPSRPLSPQPSQRSGVSSPVPSSEGISPFLGSRPLGLPYRTRSPMSSNRISAENRNSFSSSESVSSLQSQRSVLAMSASTVSPFSLSSKGGPQELGKPILLSDLGIGIPHGSTKGAPPKQYKPDGSFACKPDDGDLGKSVLLSTVADVQKQQKQHEAVMSETHQRHEAEMTQTQLRCDVLRDWRRQLEERCAGLQLDVTVLRQDKASLQQVIDELRAEVKDLRVVNEGQQEQISHLHAVRLLEDKKFTLPFGERKVGEQSSSQEKYQELTSAHANEANRLAESQEKVTSLSKKIDEMESVHVRSTLEYQLQLRQKENENSLLLSQLKEAMNRLAQVLDERR